VQRGQRRGVGGDEALVVGQVPEHLPVNDERQGILALAPGDF
jgi:hypothetical protein